MNSNDATKDAGRVKLGAGVGGTMNMPAPKSLPAATRKG